MGAPRGGKGRWTFRFGERRRALWERFSVFGGSVESRGRVGAACRGGGVVFDGVG